MKICSQLLLIILLIGCNSKGSPLTLQPPPPPEVAVAEAATSKITEFREYTGRTSAVESVEVHARVSGYVTETPRRKINDDSTRNVTVEEGKLVKKGDLLFVIDAKPYELALKQSLGSLTASGARLKQAESELTRSDTLLKSNSVSQTDYDQAFASVAELRGQIESLKATAARNQLDLEYTQVYSPIDGLLGQTSVTAGNLVVADSTILSTVVAVQPIYVHFEIDEQSVLDYRTRMLEGKVKSARDGKITVGLGLANDKGFPQEGVIDFVNNITDPGTGNTRVRATFDNNTGILSPGLFARIRAPFSAEYEAVLVPTKSIAMDQQGRHVMVVGDDRMALRRAVQLGPIEGDMTVIREGVKPGERVVTSGLQKIRQGVEVSISKTATHNQGEKTTVAETGARK